MPAVLTEDPFTVRGGLMSRPLRKATVALRYSEAHASTGFAEAARCAGMAQAISDSTIMVPMDAVRMSGSVALTLNNMDPSSLEIASAPASPAAQPMAASFAPET